MHRLVVSPYPYLVFYRAHGADIVIHAVRHARATLGIPPPTRNSRLPRDD